MTDEPIEKVVKNIDTRLAKVEQILPTLATKAELRASETRLDAKIREESERTRQYVESRLTEESERTRQYVESRLTEEGERTRQYVESRLTEEGERTRQYVEVRLTTVVAEEGERTRRHFDVVAERMESHIRVIAEGHVALTERVDGLERDVQARTDALDVRVTRLETRRRR